MVVVDELGVIDSLLGLGMRNSGSHGGGDELVEGEEERRWGEGKGGRDGRNKWEDEGVGMIREIERKERGEKEKVRKMIGMEGGGKKNLVNLTKGGGGGGSLKSG